MKLVIAFLFAGAVALFGVAVWAAEKAPDKATALPDAKAKESEKAPPAAAEPLVVTLKDKEAAQTAGPVAVGRTIEVRTAGNPTTGYVWSVKEIKGDAVKNGGEVKYTPTPVAPKIVGSGGTFTIPLEAVKAGKAEVTLIYARLWEKDQPPASSVTLTIEVQAADAAKPSATGTAAPTGTAAAPEGKAEAPAAPAAPPAKRAVPVPINGKFDPLAPGFIVLFEEKVDCKAEVARLEAQYGFAHRYIYDMQGFKGFAAHMPNETAEKLRWEPSIHSIERDGAVHAKGRRCRRRHGIAN